MHKSAEVLEYFLLHQDILNTYLKSLIVATTTTTTTITTIETKLHVVHIRSKRSLFLTLLFKEKNTADNSMQLLQPDFALAWTQRNKETDVPRRKVTVMAFDTTITTHKDIHIVTCPCAFQNFMILLLYTIFTDTKLGALVGLSVIPPLPYPDFSCRVMLTGCNPRYIEHNSFFFPSHNHDNWYICICHSQWWILSWETFQVHVLVTHPTTSDFTR